MEDIQKWIRETRDYETGVELLRKYCSDIYLSSDIVLENNSNNTSMLVDILAKKLAEYENAIRENEKSTEVVENKALSYQGMKWARDMGFYESLHIKRKHK